MSVGCSKELVLSDWDGSLLLVVLTGNEVEVLNGLGIDGKEIAGKADIGSSNFGAFAIASLKLREENGEATSATS